MAKADPVVIGAVLVLAGLWTAGAGYSGSAVLIGALLIGGALFVCLRERRYLYTLGGIMLFLLGAFYLHAFQLAREARIRLPEKGNEWSGIIRSDPVFTDRSQSFVVELNPPHHGAVRVVVYSVPEWRYGDGVVGGGDIVRTGALSGPMLESVFPDLELREPGMGSRLQSLLLGIKHRVIAVFREALPPQSAGLIEGLTLGARSDFSNTFKDAMAGSGTTHLVALSGYNIAILILAFDAIGKRFFGRRTRSVLALLGIGLFVSMVGAEASVVRAALMGGLTLIAFLAGRSYDFLRAASLVALGMTCINPGIVYGDVGFQLSFVSLLGIVYLEPFMRAAAVRKKFFRTHIAEGVLSVLTPTIAAQIAVLPILIGTFESLSLAAILANALILWLVPFLMMGGFLLAITGVMAPGLSIILALVLYIPLVYVERVILFFGTASISVHLPIPIMIFGACYYAVLIGGIWYAQKYVHAH